MGFSHQFVCLPHDPCPDVLIIVSVKPHLSTLLAKTIADVLWADRCGSNCLGFTKRSEKEAFLQ